MALDSAHLMQVLDQYQSRLHEAGNEEHDEEIEYVRQIVASPIFHQFLRGGTAQEENVHIQQASRDVLSAELSTEALLSKLTSSDIQRRRLARRKSLKALRNAVMPVNQHPPSKKSPHPSSSSSPPFGSHHGGGHAPSRSGEPSSLSSATTSPLKHAHHTKSYSGPESVRTAVAVATGAESQPPHHVDRGPVSSHGNSSSHTPSSQPPSSLMTNGGDIDTPLEGLGVTVKSPVSPRRPPDSNSLSPRTRNLSNSTNTLIERLSPPVQSPTKGHQISTGRVSAESHPNVHSLGLNRPEMDKDLFSIPRHVLSPEWAGGKDRFPNERGVVNLPLHPPLPPHPHSHYNATPNSTHRTPVAVAKASPSARLPLASEIPRHPPPALPPYEPLKNSTHKRSKSFEDILNSPEFDPLNFHRTPIPPHPMLGPQVENPSLGVTATAQGGRNQRGVYFDIYLEKGSEGLGFLVNNREGGEGGLVIQYLSPGGPAEQDGRLKPNDIITAINGVSLANTSHNEAVRLLQAVRGIVQLSCLREPDPPLPPSPTLQPPPSPPFHSSHPPPSTSPLARSPPSPLSHPHNAAVSSPHPQPFPPLSPPSLVPHPPTAQTTPLVPHPPISPTSDSGTNSEVPDMTFSTTSGQPIRQQIRTLHLPPSEEGVGISLAPHTQGGAVVTALLDRGAAKKDGRLSRGDKVLEVNEESVIHMRSEEVAARLRSLDDAREAIRLVVAHSEREGESQAVQDVIPEVMDSSGDELDEFEVELYKEGRGLGITIAGLVSEDTGDELKGLYITSINAQGAVGKDGRANVNDRILRVDGHSLRGLENMEAAAVLRNSGNPVRLVFGRLKTQEGVDERETEEEETGKTDDINGEQVHLHDNGIQETSDGDLGNGIREAPEREDSLAATNEEDVELIRKWKNVMGPNYDIKIARVVKAGSQGGLGICMESTAHLDETGKPQEGSTRHIITLVKAGPVKEQGNLMGGDEILQVNSTEVLGLEHDQAIEVVKETPVNVMIVVARRILPGSTEEAAESDDEKQNNDEGSAREDLLAPPADEGGVTLSSSGGGGGGGFGGKDISRRFERQSWRERHAEERRRLKHRFEQRREEYERHIRELEDELGQREREQKMLLAAEAEQEGRGEEGGARERRRSTLLHPSSSPTKFDYSAYHDPVTFTYHDFTEREVRSPGSDSSLSVLSPVPGTGFWEQDIATIQLHKGDEGLGFSILDFADPHNEGERIILVQSLVEGGVAEQDGRLRVGDRLISVNDVAVASTSLQFAVEQLVKIPHGSMVELGIHHPVLAESDFSDSSSLSPLPPSPSSHPLPLPTSPSSPLPLPTSPSSNPLHQEIVSSNQPSHFQQGSYGGIKRKSSSLSGAEEEESEVEEEESEVDSDEVGGEREEGEGAIREREEEKENKPAAPQEKKPKGTSEIIPADEPPHPSDPGGGERESADRRGSLSPLELSRISSPSRGMSLAEMTRVTPEDQERWRQSRESLTEIAGRGTLPPRDRFGGSLEIRSTYYHAREGSRAGDSSPPQQETKGEGDGEMQGDKLSIETSPLQKPRRGSESGPHDMSQLESSSDTTLVGSQSQSDTGMGPVADEGGAHSSRLQPVTNKKDRRSPRGKKSPKHGRKKGKSGTDTKTSPATLAVAYTHSQVTNTSSQDSIQDGLSPNMSDYDHSSELDNDPREIHIPKTSSSLGLSLTQDTKSNSILVKSVKGAIRKDGRIRVGDQILAINREWLDNVSLAKASKMLKKAASKSEGVTISYLPAPHGFSSNSYGEKSGPPQQQTTHFAPGGPPPLQQNLAGGPSLQGVPPDQDSFGQQSQMAPSHHPNIMPPQMAPPAMSQWTSYQLGPGAAISPMQPPPYNYPPTRQPFGQPPLQPVVWQVPGSLPLGQPAPQQVTWILREPPQYVDHVVQQHHMMSAAGPAHYPLSHTGPVSMTLPPPTQAGPLPSLPSKPPPVTAQLASPKSTSAAFTQPQTTTSSSSSTVPSRMTKAQSETKLGASGKQKPESDRRHNSQGSPRHPPHPYTVYRRRQQQQAQAAAVAAARAAREPTLVEEPSPKSSPSGPRNHDYSRRLQNMSRDFTDVVGGSGGQNQQQLRHSVDREVEENPELRKEFPNVEGTLFEVWLNKGSRGLGMSIVANRDDHAPGPRGIVIMGIQAGGVADRSKMVMWGDMILKINDTCVIGMTQKEVQEMLVKAPPRVRFVMLRQAEARVLERNIQQPGGGGGVDIINGLPQVRVVQLHRDNEKGLGFTVAEAGQGGVVNVASITPGGPAEKEGTLQPGDQLISIDGQKILGYSVEKARHLLQQARARGWVQLIVTSRGGSGGTGGEGTGGNLKSNIPESVVLRQKKRSKENSLKSSRRRPVSVDSESSIVRATSTSRTRDLRTGGGAETEERGERRPVTTGAVGESGDPVGGWGDGGEVGTQIGGGGGNRHSHTLTEKEVELGFQKTQQHNVIIPGREKTITIFKGSQVLGLTVIGGVDTYLHNIIIERIIPDSPAATDGRLRPGDRLLEINGQSVREATCEDVLAAFQYPSPFIHLTVLRIHSQEPQPKEATVSPTPNVETVELVRPVRGGLGLLIQESPNQSGVYVQEVVESQAAYLDGRIKAGDKILAINHTSTAVASQATVCKLLQTCVGKVVLVVQHRDALSPVLSTIDFPETDSNHHFPVQQPPPKPGVKYPFVGEPPPSHIPNRDPPPYHPPFSSYLPDPQTRGAHAAGGMWGAKQQQSSHPRPQPAGLHRSGEGKMKYIKLCKGPSGLGFTIVGGAGSSHGDKPIYVNRVLEEGVAGRVLFHGDQLLAVNGISFEGVTHKFAADTLKQQSRHGDVELTVLSFE